MKHVVVIGGGFAGLGAATRLVEARRARDAAREAARSSAGAPTPSSTRPPATSSTTGSTCSWAATAATRAFLDAHRHRRQAARCRSGCDSPSSTATAGAVARWRRRGCRRRCRSLAGLFGFSSLSWRDKLGMLKVAAAIQLPSRAAAAGRPTGRPSTAGSIGSGSRRRRGAPSSIRWRWPRSTTTRARRRPSCSRRCCARRFFGAGADGTRARAWRRSALSELYVDDARAWLQARGATRAARRRRRARRVRRGRRGARRACCAAASRSRADAVIAAVSAARRCWRSSTPSCATACRGGRASRSCRPRRSCRCTCGSIGCVTDEAMIGVVGSPLHWIFHRNQLVTRARPVAGATCRWWSRRRARSSTARRTRSCAARRRAAAALLPEAARARVVHARLIKERDATIAHTAGTEGLRPRTQSPIDGLFVAGDYVRTGLPATIESAVRAADDAADAGARCSIRRASSRRRLRPPTGAFVPLGRLEAPRSRARVAGAATAARRRRRRRAARPARAAPASAP